MVCYTKLKNVSYEYGLRLKMNINSAWRYMYLQVDTIIYAGDSGIHTAVYWQNGG